MLGKRDTGSDAHNKFGGKEMKLLDKKSLSLRVLCLMVIALMAAGMVGCGSKVPQASVNQEAEAVQESEAAQEALPEGESSSDVTVLGEGAKQFSFTVVDKEGQETNFEIHTDKEIVGEALLELGLIAGEDGQYGLYVKEVNGITADYDVDQTYWAFYTNGEYAAAGVDTTPIEEGTSYSFKVEK